jgi:hypothetical protein
MLASPNGRPLSDDKVDASFSHDLVAPPSSTAPDFHRWLRNYLGYAGFQSFAR